MGLNRLWLVLVGGLALAAAGCGGGGGGGGGGSATSPAASSGTFHVAWASPAAGEVLVAPDATVQVAFGGGLDPASVDATTLHLEVDGRRVDADLHVSGSLVTIQPRIALVPGRTYLARVTTGVRSPFGESLAAEVVWQFETAIGPAARGTRFSAGVGVADVTPRIGVPLGGHGGGARRLWIIDTDPRNFHSMFAPSQGVRDPLYAKALVLDDGVDRVAIVTLDLIAADNAAAAEVARKLAARGVAIDPSRILTCASHNHSGPGAVTDLLFWAFAAMDFYQPTVFDALTTGIADAIEMAVRGLQPARLGVGLGRLDGIAINRRAGVSPHYTRSSIDPDLGVIRVDTPDGQPIATVYNYAIHVMAFGASNLEFSADLSGVASDEIQRRVGGVAFFLNAAEGDIKPDTSVGSSEADRALILGLALADAVIAQRATLGVEADVDVATASEIVDMGQPMLEVGGAQASAAPAFIRNVMAVLPQGFGMAIPLPASFMDHEYRFQAIRLQGTLLSSIPGEAIHEVGQQIKEDGRALGFDRTFVCGLANGHMSYITTEREYNLGGYEAYGTLFGPKSGERVRAACARVMARVRR